MEQQPTPAILAEQIATATRMLVMEDIMDYSGHVSSRVPGTDKVMIQSASDPRAALDPARILTVDMDGNVVDGPAGLKPPLEVALHLEILKARPDVNTVLHCHPELAITFTLMKGVKLLALRSSAARWADGFPVHPDPSLIKTVEQGQALARTLGKHNAALIRSHGIVLTAETVPALFIDAVHFTENVRQHMLVLQAGQEPEPLSDEERDTVLSAASGRDFHVAKLWNYYVSQAKAGAHVPADWNPTL